MIDSPGTVWVVGHVSSHLIVVQCTGSNALLPYHFAHMPNLSVSLHIHMCGRQTPRDFTLYRIMSYYISIYLISISQYFNISDPPTEIRTYDLRVSALE